METKTKKAGREIAVIVLLTMALLCVTAMPAAAYDIRHAEKAVIINDGR